MERKKVREFRGPGHLQESRGAAQRHGHPGPVKARAARSTALRCRKKAAVGRGVGDPNEEGEGSLK